MKVPYTFYFIEYQKEDIADFDKSDPLLNKTIPIIPFIGDYYLNQKNI